MPFKPDVSKQMFLYPYICPVAGVAQVCGVHQKCNVDRK